MKKHILAFITILLLWNSSRGQFPGGTKAPRYWFTSFQHDSGAFFQNKIDATSPLVPLTSSKKNNQKLNNYTANYFDGATSCRIPLAAAMLQNSTIFTIYHSTDPGKEYSIWDISDDSASNLVLSTHRFADIREIRYNNYIDVFPLQPKISVVSHQRTGKPSTTSSAYLNIGRRPVKPSIPTQAFKGLIAEIIIYDGALDWNEILKVSSCLSLKYGITLSEPDATYINSQGNVIWNGYDYTDYHHNIAGIIRDDSSGLKQASATSSNEPGLLSISTDDSLQNLQSLVWGCNGQSLLLEEKKPGLPQMLRKKWLITGHTPRNISTIVDINTKIVDVDLTAKPTYWLVIDKSGSGNFVPESCDYIKMSAMTDDKIARFRNVSWGAGSASKAIFGFIAGPSYLIASSIVEPTCSSVATGEIRVKVLGASFPCTVTIHEITGKLNREFSATDTGAFVLKNIPAGKYVIRGVDKTGNTYVDSFYVNYVDGPKPPSLQSVYEVNDLQILPVDASQNMPFGASYEWVGPNGFRSTQPKIGLQHPGTYVLTTSFNGCSYVQEITVRRPPQPVFKRVAVYPNPSSGPVTVQIALEKAAHVRMDVITEDGRLIRSRDLSGFANYIITEQFDYQGIYFLVFRSNRDVATKKVEVIQ